MDTSAAEARRRIRQQLAEWRAPREICDNAQLVISELVTNALRHTDSETVGCELQLLDSLLRVAVASDGVGPQHSVRLAGEEEESGRGLLLVCALATVWGVRPRDAGRGHVVWADLPLERVGV
ncbi:ATP-binding protein [Streptomyces litchfieldiae]|uniref:ATP-binding protein n=1 Tax=Streptomyces litchfieldiae TaxID=3075543 RepID=A0ABU2N1B5_9ACTN|nr:ATP-binding protein [Streptomyces sp. DSM 44938]MDT0347099.1 ATP-binding protein [Streptomyces sp. DSM 44938]